MDARLNERLEKLADHIDELKDVEGTYLELDAHKKVLFAQLYLKADGKNVAERESQVYASRDWINFANGLVNAETELNHARRRYELKLKAFDAEYLSLKTETPVIRRHGVG
jgi:hypothetical protein